MATYPSLLTWARLHPGQPYPTGWTPGAPMPGDPANPAQIPGVSGVLGAILAQQGAAAKGALQPDLADPAMQLRLMQRMRLLAADGLQSTFANGLRGSGGPGLAASTEAADRTRWQAPPTAAPPPPALPTTESDPFGTPDRPGAQRRGGPKGWWQSPDDLRGGIYP